MRTSSELQFSAFREAAREMQGALSRGEPGSTLSGGYAPGSARAEGSSIVDEPGERALNPCARESKARTGRFLREKLIFDRGLFFSFEG